jgi:hypothetical protein
MINLRLAILKAIRASPGLKTLNKAGIAIKSANKGINIQVLFKKNPKLILERYVKSKHRAYKHTRIRMLFVKST